MREIRLSGSEGGGTGNRASLPLSRLATHEPRKTWMAGPSPAMTMGAGAAVSFRPDRPDDRCGPRNAVGRWR